jgi:hypothetical protein
MRAIINQEIRDSTIDIDDQFFLNCTLIRCTLVSSGQDFKMQNCRIVDCRVRWVGDAATTARPLEQLSKANNRVVETTRELD